MSTRALVFPDVDLRVAGTTLVSEWHVTNAQQQRDAAEALLSEWDELSATFAPDAFIQLSCFGDLDGRTVLNFAQWTSDEAHAAFTSRHRQDMVGRIDRALPGIQRPGLVRCRPHSTLKGVPAAPASEEAVVVRAVASSPERTAEWADATHRALESTLPDGVCSAHVLLSADGTQCVLYAPCADGAETSHARLGHLPRTAGVAVDAPRRYRLLGSVLGPGLGAL